MDGILFVELDLAVDHIGGSRAIAAASDHDAARPVFQSASVLIAEYLPAPTG
jgi:hypothetical protein